MGPRGISPTTNLRSRFEPRLPAFRITDSEIDPQRTRKPRAGVMNQATLRPH